MFEKLKAAAKLGFARARMDKALASAPATVSGDDIRAAVIRGLRNGIQEAMRSENPDKRRIARRYAMMSDDQLLEAFQIPHRPV